MTITVTLTPVADGTSDFVALAIWLAVMLSKSSKAVPFRIDPPSRNRATSSTMRTLEVENGARVGAGVGT